jgi:hypothetical protein
MFERRTSPCHAAQFYEETRGLLPQLLQLLGSFVNRSHQSLAAGGVYALTHLTSAAGASLHADDWQVCVVTFGSPRGDLMGHRDILNASCKYVVSANWWLHADDRQGQEVCDCTPCGCSCLCNRDGWLHMYCV